MIKIKRHKSKPTSCQLIIRYIFLSLSFPPLLPSLPPPLKGLCLFQNAKCISTSLGVLIILLFPALLTSPGSKSHLRGWTESSAVKSICCSSRIKFPVPMLGGSSQPPLTLALEDVMSLAFTSTYTHMHIPTYDHTHLHIIKNKNLFKNGTWMTYWKTSLEKQTKIIELHAVISLSPKHDNLWLSF